MMNVTMRYILVILGVIISLHYILTLTHTSYAETTSLSNLSSYLRPGSYSSADKSVPDEYKVFDDVSTIPDHISNNGTLALDRKANATFVILARNSDVDSTIRSIREIEDRFNRFHRYPYVMLNDVEWDEDVKTRLSVLTSSRMEFGVVPREHWVQPDWIDETKATESRDRMVREGVIYGGSVSYRNMCRFNSGFFFRHPLMEKYRWYWRIEPDVHFHCDINFDPFVYMEERGKIYGFTITMYEFEKTIPTLWEHTKDFVKLHPEHVAPDNAMGFLSENAGDTYNLCHFWSNFEIADMNFWRSKAYMDYFDYLESKGGFYYERWGDAPVHSIAAALFASKNQIQFFDEIGYEHNPYTHCPQSEDNWKRGRCTCNPKRNFDYDGYSCMSKWDRIMESS